VSIDDQPGRGVLRPGAVRPVTVLPAAENRQYRWRNGLGESSEIAAEPVSASETTGWTLSIATVEADLAFSRFPGVDRKLMALSAGGLDLVIDGERRSLARWQVAAFPGEVAVSSIGVTEPTLDLNLMVARDRQEGTLVTFTVLGLVEIVAPEDTTIFVVLLEGELSAGDRALDVHDAVRIDAGGALPVAGSATVAVARIRSYR